MVIVSYSFLKKRCNRWKDIISFMWLFYSFALDLINGVSSDAKVDDSQGITMNTEEELLEGEEKPFDVSGNESQIQKEIMVT